VKKCQKCQNLLPSDAFGVRSSERDGLNLTCKGCIKSAKIAVRERDAPKSQCSMCLQFKFVTDFPLRRGRRREVCKDCTGVSRPSAFFVAQGASEVRKYVASVRARPMWSAWRRVLPPGA
jgi:RNase P subunit RPR2